MRGINYEPQISLTGGIQTLSLARKTAVFNRSNGDDAAINSRARELLEGVRIGGDSALREMAARFDGVRLDDLEVPRTRWKEAVDGLSPSLRTAIERAIRNLESVQTAFVPVASETSPEPGVIVGRRPDSLGSVGVYAPGGRATYPSSVLMGAVPARVAGVREIILCSPPGPDGLPSQVVLAAAELAGVSRVFAIGGAGAIGALAYGTETVPRVDRIVGPGNAYVAQAKLLVSGVVAIDSPAGPSELLVIADSSADLDVVVREVMAQAEHDPRAVVVVVAIGESVADTLIARVIDAIPLQQRSDTISESMRSRGAILWAADEDDAIEFSNAFAPEHLLVATRNAKDLLPRLRNAGTIFIGECSSVSFGDYMTGANHVLPTGGLARCYSGLSVLDFIRWTTYQIIDPAAASRLAVDVAVFADSEGLFAHSAAARQWAPAGATAGEIG